MTERRHRVVLVGNSVPYFVSHRLPFALALARAGYDLHLACPEGELPPIIEASEITVHRIPFTRAGMSPVGEFQVLRSLTQLYKTLAPDLVHHVTVKPIVWGSLAARMANVPIVINAVTGLGYVFLAQGIRARIVRGVMRLLYGAAFEHPNVYGIFQNDDDAKLFTTWGAVGPDRQIMIRGSGVDVSRFTPSSLPEDVPVVVLPSRMLVDKGVFEFVAAARQLKDRGVDARFVLAGGTDPNPTSIPEAQLKAWHAEGIVEWWGHQSDMPSVFRQASVVCLPSYREGLPKALIEAAACARPIVTTDAPGCRDVVIPGKTGYLVPVKDSTALAGALERVLTDHARAVAMGCAGRERAVSVFALDGVIQQLLDAYESILARTPIAA